MESTPQIKFLHIRRPAMRIGTNGMQIERAGPYGGITVAYRHLGDGLYEVGFGRCRNDERYDKKIGRTAAKQHLLQNGGQVQVPFMETDALPYNQIAEMVYKGAMKKNLRPAVTIGRL